MSLHDEFEAMLQARADDLDLEDTYRDAPTSTPDDAAQALEAAFVRLENQNPEKED